MFPDGLSGDRSEAPMVQPPRTTPLIRDRIAGPPAIPPWNDDASSLPRALAIRAHLLPLIRAMAADQRASGLSVLIVVAPPYTISYRRPLVGAGDAPHRLEI